MIKVVAKMTLSPEALESAMPILEELIAATVLEDGCVNYNFCQHTESADTFAIIETWETQESLDVHGKSEHFGRLVPQLAGLATGDIEISAYTVQI
ncbi:MAG: antibiotic biosynthesis monooxygenase [Coriobacteriia bacterium]|nr:antibiotic biosynthesis monooxygenase [Coriobacteriia bacterium]MCL2750933.1 antibiotic biosynthesis monooxygenase [Coriobacteriia bacterium]